MGEIGRPPIDIRFNGNAAEPARTDLSGDRLCLRGLDAQLVLSLGSRDQRLDLKLAGAAIVVPVRAAARVAADAPR